MVKYFFQYNHTKGLVSYSRYIFSLSNSLFLFDRFTLFQFNLFVFFLKMGQPGLFLLFFQTRITIFTTNKCKECPSSIRCWYLERESPLITTRPGLLPYYLFSLKYFPIYKTAILTCRSQLFQQKS